MLKSKNKYIIYKLKYKCYIVIKIKKREENNVIR